MKRISIFILAVLLFSGCTQRRPDDLPRLYPVQLTFTQQGKPLDDATVTLKAKNRTTHYTCGGRTDADGVLTVQTHGRYRGAPEGTYVVTVMKSVRESSGPFDEMPAGASEQRTWFEKNRHRFKEDVFRTVDPKFADEYTSNLEVVVTPSGAKASFDLGAPLRLEAEPSHLR